MLSKLRQLIDPNRDEQWDDHKQDRHSTSLYEREMDQLHRENEKLKEQLDHLRNELRLSRMHLEFFYYHPQASSEQQYSERELDHLPVMCITVHFMERDKPIPQWLFLMLAGLEDTLSAMKVPYRNVSEPHVYSIFVDTKLYPQQEVKKVLHVLIKQLERLHMQDEKVVTTRVHVGGEELYDDLLDVYEDQRQFS